MIIGAIPISKYMPLIGEIANSAGPIADKVVVFRVDMASPITQTPQVYSAQLLFEAPATANYALCEKGSCLNNFTIHFAVAYGGKRFVLVSENEAISPTLN